MPLTLAGFIYSNRTAILSGMVAWWCLIFAFQQFDFLRKKRISPFLHFAPAGLLFCFLSLSVSLLLSNDFFSSFFEYISSLLFFFFFL